MTAKIAETDFDIAFDYCPLNHLRTQTCECCMNLTYLIAKIRQQATRDAVERTKEKCLKVFSLFEQHEEDEFIDAIRSLTIEEVMNPDAEE